MTILTDNGLSEENRALWERTFPTGAPNHTVAMGVEMLEGLLNAARSQGRSEVGSLLASQSAIASVPPFAQPDDEVRAAWLEECAKYFASRPSGGEDAMIWANAYNGENARKIAARLRELSSQQASKGGTERSDCEATQTPIPLQDEPS